MNSSLTARVRVAVQDLRRATLVIALLATALTLNAPTDAGALNAPRGFFGVHPRTADNVDYAEMADANVGLLRTGFDIDAVRTHQNDPADWNRFDEVVAGTATNGIDLLPVLVGVPNWITRQSGATPLGNSETEWHDFLVDLAERYGPEGEFWSLNPEVPYRPIGEWQIWNEPNLLGNWENKPDAREYGKLLTLSAHAIHEIDPDARLVSAGIVSQPSNPEATDGDRFLKTLLKVKSIARSDDVVAIHPYSGTIKEVKREIKLTREVMDDAGFRRTPIWVTEVGWGSGKSKRNPLIVSKARQRNNLRGSFTMALQERRRFGLERMVWYQWRDGEDTICGWCGTSGLLAANGLAKPLLGIFQAIARR